MKANYTVMNRSEAVRIARAEVEKSYKQTFADCAADVMQQTLATVLLTLERSYGWKDKRLKDFVANLRCWVDAMERPTDLTGTWETTDNIDYFREVYGIDLRKEFEAEVSK